MKNIPYEKTYINITLKRHMITNMSPKKGRINNNYRFRKGKSKNRSKVKSCKRKNGRGRGVDWKVEWNERVIHTFFLTRATFPYSVIQSDLGGIFSTSVVRRTDAITECGRGGSGETDDAGNLRIIEIDICY